MFNPRPDTKGERLLGFWLAVMVVALVAAFFFLPLVLFFVLVVVVLLFGIFVRVGRLERR